MKRIFIFVAVCMVYMAIESSAQTVNLTTYYPSPFGEYDRMRLFPKSSDLGGSCDIGTMYSRSNGSLRICVDDGAGTGEWVLGSPWVQDEDNVYPFETASNTAIKVGIGTVLPQTLLHLYDGINDNPALRIIGPVDDGGIIELGDLDTPNLLVLSGANSGSGAYAIGAYAYDSMVIGTVPDREISFLTDNTLRMTIEADGDVSFTENLLGPLNIEGALRLHDAADEDRILEVGYNALQDYSYITSFDYGAFVGKDLVALVTPTNDGNLGIGTETPQSKASIYGNMSVGTTYSSASAAPSDGLIVEGNVGIGTDSPSVNLAIHGTVHIVDPVTPSEYLHLYYDEGSAFGVIIAYDSNSGTYQDLNLNPYGGSVGVNVEDKDLDADFHMEAQTMLIEDDDPWFILKDGNDDDWALHSDTSDRLQIEADTGSGFSPVLTVDSSGRLGVGVSSPGAALAVSGLASAAGNADLRIDTTTGNVSYLSSSRKDKIDISDFDDDFQRILDVTPKSFRYKSNQQKDIGYIAEDFDELGLKDLVDYTDAGEVVGIKYDRMSLYLVEVIKKQQQQIDELTRQLESLQKVSISNH